MKLLLSDGTEAGPDDIRNAVQETDLWKGIITSRFELDGIPVVVRTACHPDLDMIGVEVKSDLIRKGRLSVFINFPYADRNQGAAYVGVYDQPEKHHSSIKKQTGQSVRISREMDGTHYSAILRWKSPAQFSLVAQENPHYFELRPSDTDFRTGSQKVLLTSFVFPSETGTFRIQTDRFAQVFCSQVHRNRKLVFTFATHQLEEGK